MNQIRMEVRVNGSYTYSQSLAIFRRYISEEDEPPDGVLYKDEVTWKSYLGNVSSCFKDIEKGKLFKGT